VFKISNGIEKGIVFARTGIYVIIGLHNQTILIL